MTRKYCFPYFIYMVLPTRSLQVQCKHALERHLTPTWAPSTNWHSQGGFSTKSSTSTHRVHLSNSGTVGLTELQSSVKVQTGLSAMLKHTIIMSYLHVSSELHRRNRTEPQMTYRCVNEGLNGIWGLASLSMAKVGLFIWPPMHVFLVKVTVVQCFQAMKGMTGLQFSMAETTRGPIECSR